MRLQRARHAYLENVNAVRSVLASDDTGLGDFNRDSVSDLSVLRAALAKLGMPRYTAIGGLVGHSDADDFAPDSYAALAKCLATDPDSTLDDFVNRLGRAHPTKHFTLAGAGLLGECPRSKTPRAGGLVHKPILTAAWSGT